MQVFLAILTLLKPSGLPNFNKLESWEMVIQEPSYIQCFVIPYCQEKKISKKKFIKMYSLPFNSIYITNYMFTCRLRRSTKPLAHYEMSRLPPRFFYKCRLYKKCVSQCGQVSSLQKMSLKGTKKGSLLVKRGTFLKLLNAHKSGHTFSWSDCKK